MMSMSSPAGIIARDEAGVRLYPTGTVETHEWSGKTLVGPPAIVDADHFVCMTTESLVRVARGADGWRSTLVPHDFTDANVDAFAETPDTWWLCGSTAIERLRSVDIPVIVTYGATVADVLDDIRLVGTVTGEAAAADDLADEMGAQFETVRTATAGIDHPKVFYELDATSKIFTAAISFASALG